jgi:hypothetical protein
MSPWSRLSTRLGAERGQVGGIEVLPFGFLVFVAGTLLIANAWAVIDAKLAVTAASREAARVYVESADIETATGAAHARAFEALDAYGRDEPGRAELAIEHLDGSFGRCRRVAVTATYRVPALTIPFIRGFGTSVTARSRHTEVIDPFRDGLDEGSCT